MAIRTIEDITIDGKNMAYRGHIYSFDMDVGMGNEITKVVVDFVNEDGIFLEPALSVLTPHRIKVGNIIDDMFYAISYVQKKTSSGRTLTVTFYDGSILLDRLWIGLHKRMGDKTTMLKTSNLILVGTEYHPCDVNEDGVYDELDVAELAYDQTDPCELRCPSDYEDSEPIIESCAKKAALEIFPVRYNFTELLEAIAHRVTVARVPSNINPKYYQTFTGTLREVLANWCGEMGWTFYWEDGKLNFIDITKATKINFRRFENLMDLSESASTGGESITLEKTLEGTFSRGAISHFAEAGIESKQDCSQSRAYLLNCLTLKDLFGSYYNPKQKAIKISQGSESAPDVDGNVAAPEDASEDKSYYEYSDDVYIYGVPVDKFEESCVCAYYGEGIRNLYNLYNYYGINNYSFAEEMVGLRLNRFGNMKIRRVIAKDGDNQAIYRKLMSDPLSDGTVVLPPNSPERAHFIQNNGYFVLGEFDPDHLIKSYDIENNLAQKFMGQHWYRAYRAPNIGETPQMTPGGQYFGALNNDIKEVPFSAFRPAVNSKVGRMLQGFILKQADNFTEYGSFIINRPQVVRKGLNKIVKSLIYYYKNPIWSPTSEVTSYLDSFYREKEKLLPRVIDVDPSLLGRFLKDQYGTSIVKPEDLKKIKLIAMFPGTFTMESEFSENYDDELPSHEQDIGGYALASFGLLSRNAVAYYLDGIKVFTPTASSMKYTENATFEWGRRGTTIENRGTTVNNTASPSNFKVLVTTSVKGRGFIPKTESTLINFAEETHHAMKVDYNIQDINKSSIKYINRLNNQTCGISEELLAAAHAEVNERLAFDISRPLITNEYSLYGITFPSKIKIKEGLEKIKIRIDENGVKTNITIGNKNFIPPSPEYLQKKVEFALRADIRYGRRNPL